MRVYVGLGEVSCWHAWCLMLVCVAFEYVEFGFGGVGVKGCVREEGETRLSSSSIGAASVWESLCVLVLTSP